eukprot:947259-Amphidinium_carterae.2
MPIENDSNSEKERIRLQCFRLGIPIYPRKKMMARSRKGIWGATKLQQMAMQYRSFWASVVEGSKAVKKICDSYPLRKPHKASETTPKCISNISENLFFETNSPDDTTVVYDVVPLSNNNFGHWGLNPHYHRIS